MIPVEASTSATTFVHLGPTRVRVQTRGSGPPLLLLMGIGGNLDMWDPLAHHLAGRELIMFDFPGTGGSTGAWWPPTMLNNAIFVRLLMKKLGYARMDVLGYSWGGLLAQKIALQHPRMVRRLILACTSFGLGSLPAKPWVAARLLTPRRYYSPAYLTRIAADTYGGRFRTDPTLVRGEVNRRMAHPPSLGGYAHQLVATATFSSLAALPLLKAPTLILAGDDDPLVAAGNQHILAWLIRHSELQMLRKSGHLLLLESPDLAGRIIQSFLESSPSA